MRRAVTDRNRKPRKKGPRPDSIFVSRNYTCESTAVKNFMRSEFNLQIAWLRNHKLKFEL